MIEPLWVILVVTVLLGLVAGYMGGLLGVGGGIVFVPMLLLTLPGVMENDFNIAKTASLFALTFTSVVGTLRHHQFGSVDVRLGLLLGAAGVPSAVIGALVGAMMPLWSLELAFGGIMLASAVKLASPPREDRTLSSAQILALGLGGGLLSGMLGVGGGIVLVNGMLLLGINAHQAVGSSMLAIILNGGSGMLANATKGFLVLEVALPLTAGALVGAYAGATKANSVEQERLRWYFRVVLVALGTYMVVRGIGTLV